MEVAQGKDGGVVVIARLGVGCVAGVDGEGGDEVEVGGGWEDGVAAAASRGGGSLAVDEEVVEEVEGVVC